MADTYQHLTVWEKAIDLASSIYTLTKAFPKDEQFGMVSQLRRASISVSANLAEGSGRGTKKEYRRFVEVSIGSLNEIESILFVARKIGYVKEKEYMKIKEEVDEVGKMLWGFKRYLNKE